MFAALDAVMSAGSLGGLAMSGLVIGAFGVRSAYATAGVLAGVGARARDRAQARISTGVPVGASFMIRRMFAL